MREFQFYVQTQAVKKQSPDKHLAHATARDSTERLAMAKSILLPQKPKYAFENAYEAVREMIDAILFLEGYKSYSHEASVAYLSHLGFSFSDIQAVDRLRKKRNDIKYYGGNVDDKEAGEAIGIAEDIIKRLSKKKPELHITS